MGRWAGKLQSIRNRVRLQPIRVRVRLRQIRVRVKVRVMFLGSGRWVRFRLT